MTKRLLIFLISIAIVGIFSTGCALQSVTEPHQVDPTTEPTPVPTSIAVAKVRYDVQEGTVRRQIQMSGQVVPITETAAQFVRSGTIASVDVKRGADVIAGDVIATLDTEALQRDLVTAQSGLTVAEARLDAAQAAVERQRRRAEIALEMVALRLTTLTDSLEDEATSEQSLQIGLLELEVELAELNLEELDSAIDATLEAEVAQAQLRVDTLLSDIEQSILLAPEDGTILRLNLGIGQAVSAGDVGAILADLTLIEVRAVLTSEDDLERLLEGDEATIAAAGRPSEIVDGFVRLLPPPYGGGVGLDDGTLRLGFVDGDSAEFSSSDRVTIDLLLAENNDVLWLPSAAIREFKGRSFVIIEDGETQRRVDVTLGLEGNDRVEILEGVSSGDTVIGP